MTAARICVPLAELGGGVFNPAAEVANPGRVCVSASTEGTEWDACGFWRDGEWEIVREVGAR
ncbi:MAG TPA: hypothetical protein VFM37_06085 [Pseudonocardiaceae bacterium]|nr:hypothetical protein [Pseudonocardiaceae bacterium]